MIVFIICSQSKPKFVFVTNKKEKLCTKKFSNFSTTHKLRYWPLILVKLPEIRLSLPFSDWFETKRTSIWFQIHLVIKSNRNHIVFTIFRLIWNQTDVHFGSHGKYNLCMVNTIYLVHGKYNLISVWMNKFPKSFLSFCNFSNQGKIGK